MAADFIASLPLLTDFAATADRANYLPLPGDWRIVISDVVGSTDAITEGKYKEVNLVGASTITAVINAVKPVDVLFAFGGDGATLAIPPQTVDAAAEALRATQRMAEEQFGLKLRVGIVPMADIRATGADVLAARLRISDNYDQAAFTGGGLAAAERLVKDPVAGRKYRLGEDDKVAPKPADYSGLECRWQAIASPHGETTTLLVCATSTQPDKQAATYRAVLQELHEIYGDPDAYRPVRLDMMKLAEKREDLAAETKLRSHFSSPISRILYGWWLRFQMFCARFMFPRMMKTPGIDWGQYQRDIVANTDFRKFDDMLRQVLSGTPKQRERLTEYLEGQRRAGLLCFGIHSSPAALMTCLVFTRAGRHVHFVDGSAGGYAMAAKQMKSQRE